MPPFAFRSPIMDGAADRWKKGGGSQGLMRIMRDEENLGSYTVFLRFTVAMLAVPAVTMFVAHQYALDLLFTFRTSGDRMAYAGVAAIISVQFVILAFIIFAFIEEPASTVGKAKAS